MIGYIGVMDALTISNEFRLTREVQTLRVEKSKMFILAALVPFHLLEKYSDYL